MAFIEKKNPIVLNIKLTSKGRELLAGGELDFKYFGVGDSEVDYKFNAEVNTVDGNYTAFDSSILRAADKNPKLISFIPRNVSGNTYNEMTNIPITAYAVENQVESLGFFTNNNTEYIIDSNHVKQPDCRIDMSIPNGGDVITLLKASTYGTSGEEPAVGDILYVKWTYYQDTTGFAVQKNYPAPNLFYRITEIITGTLSSGSVSVRVDREIPDFSNGTPPSGVYAGAMILYNEISFSGDTIINMSSTDYLDESVLSFLENSQCPTIVFPYWNMSIVYTEEIAGVQAGNLKYTQFKNRKFGGFVSYIQNQAPVLKKLGIIHYTNSSPANVYGEGFLQDTPTLDIPTIMWHKSTTQTLGTTLSAIGGQNLLTGLDIHYYDLGDSSGFIVGKIFPDLKIFVIEDQELLFAMSYKSNRSWTLSDFIIPTNDIKPPSPAEVLVDTIVGSIYDGIKILTGGENIIKPTPIDKYGMQYKKTGTSAWIFTPTTLINGPLNGNLWQQGIFNLDANTDYDYRAYILYTNGITTNGDTLQIRTTIPTTTTTTTTTAAPTTTTTTTTTAAPTTTTTTTIPVPAVTTGTVTLVGNNSLFVRFNELDNSYSSPIIEYGTLYSEGSTPIKDDSGTYCVSNSGPLADGTIWDESLTGLHEDTTYSYRAYATNNVGTGVGIIKTATTSSPPPTTKYTLTITQIGNVNGLVVKDPTQPVGGYDVGTVVEVEGISEPSVPSYWHNWVINGFIGVDNPISITMNSDKTICANFTDQA